MSDFSPLLAVIEVMEDAEVLEAAQGDKKIMTDGNDLPELFLHWVKELSELPGSAPEWNHVEWLRTEISRVAALKASEREAEVRDNLQETITSLQGNAPILKGELYIDISGWHVDNCTCEQLETASREILQFGSVLSEFLNLIAQQPKSFREVIERDKRRLELAQAVAEKCELLNGMLGIAADMPSPGKVEEPSSKPADDKVDGEYTVTVVNPKSGTDVVGEDEMSEGPGPPSPEELIVAEPSNIYVEEASTSPTALLWPCLERGDISGAYWISRALGNASPVPEWLLSANAASSWLVRGASIVENDLLSIVEAQKCVAESAPLITLQVAAALLPSLATPGAGAMEWLHLLPAPFAGLNDLVQVVREFASSGLPLRPEDLVKVGGRESCFADAAAYAERAQEWRDTAAQRKFMYPLAGQVFQFLLRQRDGSLRKIIDQVAANRQSEVEEIVTEISVLRERTCQFRLVRDAEKAVYFRAKTNRLEGKDMGQLLEAINQGLTYAQEWCTAVRQLQIATERNEWWQELVEKLATGIERTLPQANSLILRLATNEQPDVRAAALILQKTLDDLKDFLQGIPLDASVVPPLAHQGLVPGLSFRLLLHPNLDFDFDEQGFPALKSFDQVVENMAAEPPDIDEALNIWCHRRDFRWVDTLLEGAKTSPNHPLLVQTVASARDLAASNLAEDADNLRELLEQALIEGTVDQNIKTRIDAEILEATDQANARLGEFGQWPARIENAKQMLVDSATAVLTERRGHWERLIEPLRASLDASLVEHLTDVVEDALQSRNIYLLDEALSQADRALANDTPDQITNFLALCRSDRERARQDVLSDFLNAQPGLGDLIEHAAGDLQEIERAIAEDSSRLQADLGMQDVPPAWCEQVNGAIAAWRSLKQDDGEERAMALHLYTLLNYLGFRLRPDSPEALRLEDRVGWGWSLWQANISAKPLSPVPQLGSYHRDAPFPVLCLRERSGTSTIETITHEVRLSDNPYIIIYLNSLSRRQWEEMAYYAHRTGRQALVLDETLMLFLAREYESRLNSFFHCTLPSADVNPYVPYVAGNVPSEMFFGRDDMRRRLIEAHGPAFVYGGRQLGKSSLLRSTEREFHKPDKNHFSFTRSMATVGMPGGSKRMEDVWTELVAGLREVGLIKPTASIRLDRVRDEILSVMRDPTRKLLVMLDDADALLTDDAENGFPVVSAIKQLMDDTAGRFKVVFCGLHNVRRFLAVPNHPLAHLSSAATVIVGPLEPPAARELVHKPMEALGFRFKNKPGDKDESVVMSILSMCNYHPGLTQLFCQKLIEYLRHDRTVVLPYTITAEDIQAVYRDAQLRDEIRSAFRLTLDLDTHYGVLVRALVLDQMAHHHGFAVSYSVQEIHRLGKYWWSKCFSEEPQEYVREYVQELVDLWVLAPCGEGRYRLRSPNLVRLLGAQEDIECYLEPFVSDSTEPLDLWRDADRLHPCVQEKPTLYSPLTVGQLRRLGLGRNGVILVFGSKATGLDSLAATVLAMSAWLNGAQCQCEHIDTSGDAATLERSLSGAVGIGGACPLLLWGTLQGAGWQLADQVRQALSFLESKQVPGRWIQVMLVIEPDHLPEWLSLDPGEREAIEAQCGIFSLERWSPVAVRQWLEKQMPQIATSAASVIEATAGFQLLISALSDHLDQAGTKEPRKAISDLQEIVSDTRSELAVCFRDGLGLRPGTPLDKVFGAMFRLLGPHEFGVEEVLVDLVAHELQVGSEEVLSGVLGLRRLSLIETHEDGRIRVVPLARQLLSPE